MLAKKYHINTTKEIPTDAELVSHRLMIRTGMIRMLAKGIYTYMPLCLKIIRKIEAIIREEMKITGAIELLMPFVQPVEPWKKSGRLDEYGLELLRVKDRQQRNFVLQPTSEEVITTIAEHEIYSYKQLPISFYHIQTKFRDELRPRFGLIRSREFMMKDGYSFDCNEKEAKKSYKKMLETYVRIFKRFGLAFKIVNADTGSIGGYYSHEFHIIAASGENKIIYDQNSEYATNIELAEAPCLIKKREKPKKELSIFHIPDEMKQHSDLENWFQIPLEKIVKCLVLVTQNELQNLLIHLLLVRGDHEFNKFKINKLSCLHNARVATESEILEHFSCSSKYVGPLKERNSLNIIVDHTVANMTDFTCGANSNKTYYCGLNWGRDIKEPDLVTDLRNFTIKELQEANGSSFPLQRSIEVGHIFFLGDKYSKLMKATFLNHHGERIPFQMGCYGIGISRIIAAAIEQNHDEKGIKWPKSIAPFEIVICPISWNTNESVRKISSKIYNSLISEGIDVILDNRGNRPGVMFSEWDLIGIPLRVTVGAKDIENGIIELKNRFDGKVIKIPIESASKQILETLEILDKDFEV